MVIDLGQSTFKLYLYANITDLDNFINGRIYFKSQLSNKLLEFDVIGGTQDYFSCGIIQKGDYVEISGSTFDVFNNIDIAGYYNLIIEYYNGNEFIKYPTEFLIKVKNSTYNNNDATFNEGIKEYKIFNG